jgi:hypothetical protein
VAIKVAMATRRAEERKAIVNSSNPFGEAAAAASSGQTAARATTFNIPTKTVNIKIGIQTERIRKFSN